MTVRTDHNLTDIIVYVVFYGTVAGIIVALFVAEYRQQAFYRKTKRALQKDVKEWKAGQLFWRLRHLRWLRKFFWRHN